MSDLVERLRDSAKHWVHEVDTRIEAANEIEWLQARVTELEKDAARYQWLRDKGLIDIYNDDDAIDAATKEQP